MPSVLQAIFVFMIPYLVVAADGRALRNAAYKIHDCGTELLWRDKGRQCACCQVPHCQGTGSRKQPHHRRKDGRCQWIHLQHRPHLRPMAMNVRNQSAACLDVHKKYRLAMNVHPGKGTQCLSRQ
jgi:hypothetical protein